MTVIRDTETGNIGKLPLPISYRSVTPVICGHEKDNKSPRAKNP